MAVQLYNRDGRFTLNSGTGKGYLLGKGRHSTTLELVFLHTGLTLWVTCIINLFLLSHPSAILLLHRQNDNDFFQKAF